MKYKVKLPKTICLILIISKFAKELKFFNTNDLVDIANQVKPELARQRKDKKDYKYFDDTNFGGLRGNLSTALTLIGCIKRDNRTTAYYGLGKTDRLLNAYRKGEILLDKSDFIAYTTKKELKELLEFESKNYLIRENQAHIKRFLKNNEDFPLKRDDVSFPKISVLKSNENQYFLRAKFNTYCNENVIEYSMYNYLVGPKVKEYNIHALFIVPSKSDDWDKFLVIDSKELLTRAPLFVYYDIQKKKFYDNKQYEYPFYELKEGIDVLPDENGNIEERLDYDYTEVRDEWSSSINVSMKDVKEEEFYVFLKEYLNWKETFSIYDKEVVDIKVSSSGGVDVFLQFSGGTEQKLELEHEWVNYIRHGHHKSPVWENAWLYANEQWDFEKIKKIFGPHLSKYSKCIPKVFLCTNKETKEKEAYEVEWKNCSYKKIEVKD